MIRFLRLIAVAAIAGLLTFPLLAAEAELESQSQEVSENEQSDANVASQVGSAPDSESEIDDASEDERPSRFIPTEQISQDLGVSFPADI
ncbi:MAG: hypothetical protein KJN90_10240 [Gammaproteobacteria bacterium]|nr:hypothetical protein [Gammaproteobacteria bacterium]